MPYDRPPLTKKLWFGQKKVEEIFVHNQDFYNQKVVNLVLGKRVIALDAKQRSVKVEKGAIYHFERLLLATGAIPRPLPIPGGDLEGICYYRYLDDYLGVRSEASEDKSFIQEGLYGCLKQIQKLVKIKLGKERRFRIVFPRYVFQKSDVTITAFSGNPETFFLSEKR